MRRLTALGESHVKGDKERQKKQKRASKRRNFGQNTSDELNARTYSKQGRKNELEKNQSFCSRMYS